MRAFLLRGASLFGLHGLFRFLHRHTLTVLLYHGVAPSKDIGIYNYRKKFIDPLIFARQMEYLRRKYTILPLEEAIQRLHDGTLPPYAMAVTFDDGYENNYTYAFPVLRAHSVPATIYLTTDFVEKHLPLWVDRLEHLIGFAKGAKDTPRDEKAAADALLRQKLKGYGAEVREKKLKELESSAGVALKGFEGDASVYAPITWEECRMMRTWRIAFGAHTASHPILSRLSFLEQREEIGSSRKIVSDALGSVSSIFAYPNGQPGDFTDETVTTLKELGFTGALTTTPGVNTKKTHPFRLKRISMDRTEDWDIFLLATSGALGWFSTLKRLIS
jgi:peptidoglycan/xylan/chitin deacetylase (PgdA/CDA1 family)